MKARAAILEIRAGTGGEEAALFARDLFRSYSRYAQKKEWPLEIFDQNLTDLGGCRKIIFRLNHRSAWEKFQYEGGTHRVQRIPATEKVGRTQTSTVTVAAYPQSDHPVVKIRPNDLKIDSLKSSGPGGQHVNKRETAVRVTHQPTGLTVTCQTSRSQQRNRELALELLLVKLEQLAQEKHQAKARQIKQAQIGSGKRAEKIRTYHFSQNRITDHRIKKSWHNLEEVMKGDWDKIFKALSSAK